MPNFAKLEMLKSIYAEKWTVEISVSGKYPRCYDRFTYLLYFDIHKAFVRIFIPAHNSEKHFSSVGKTFFLYIFRA